FSDIFSFFFKWIANISNDSFSVQESIDVDKIVNIIARNFGNLTEDQVKSLRDAKAPGEENGNLLEYMKQHASADNKSAIAAAMAKFPEAKEAATETNQEKKTSEDNILLESPEEQRNAVADPGTDPDSLLDLDAPETHREDPVIDAAAPENTQETKTSTNAVLLERLEEQCNAVKDSAEELNDIGRRPIAVHAGYDKTSAMQAVNTAINLFENGASEDVISDAITYMFPEDIDLCLDLFARHDINFAENANKLLHMHLPNGKTFSSLLPANNIAANKFKIEIESALSKEKGKTELAAQKDANISYTEKLESISNELKAATTFLQDNPNASRKDVELQAEKILNPENINILLECIENGSDSEEIAVCNDLFNFLNAANHNYTLFNRLPLQSKCREVAKKLGSKLGVKINEGKFEPPTPKTREEFRMQMSYLKYMMNSKNGETRAKSVDYLCSQKIIKLASDNGWTDVFNDVFGNDHSIAKEIAEDNGLAGEFGIFEKQCLSTKTTPSATASPNEAVQKMNELDDRISGAIDNTSINYYDTSFTDEYTFELAVQLFKEITNFIEQNPNATPEEIIDLFGATLSSDFLQTLARISKNPNPTQQGAIENLRKLLQTKTFTGKSLPEALPLSSPAYAELNALCNIAKVPTYWPKFGSPDNFEFNPQDEKQLESVLRAIEKDPKAAVAFLLTEGKYGNLFTDNQTMEKIWKASNEEGKSIVEMTTELGVPEDITMSLTEKYEEKSEVVRVGKIFNKYSNSESGNINNLLDYQNAMNGNAIQIALGNEMRGKALSLMSELDSDSIATLLRHPSGGSILAQLTQNDRGKGIVARWLEDPGAREIMLEKHSSTILENMSTHQMGRGNQVSGSAMTALFLLHPVVISRERVNSGASHLHGLTPKKGNRLQENILIDDKCNDIIKQIQSLDLETRKKVLMEKAENGCNLAQFAVLNCPDETVIKIAGLYRENGLEIDRSFLLEKAALSREKIINKMGPRRSQGERDVAKRVEFADPKTAAAFAEELNKLLGPEVLPNDLPT
ncbi:MAG: hypothetical protein LBS68_02230, partial [Puniceicoccales bacterium]|nr:hypothetical protein [Puniceicoccales bacterium]